MVKLLAKDEMPEIAWEEINVLVEVLPKGKMGKSMREVINWVIKTMSQLQVS